MDGGAKMVTVLSAVEDPPTVSDVVVDRVQQLHDKWVNNPRLRRGAAARELNEAMTIDPLADTQMLGVAAENGNAVLRAGAQGPQSHAVLLALTAEMGQMLHTRSAPNYVEFEVITKSESFIAHVRTGDRPSPHDLRRRAESRLAELEHALTDADNDPRGFVAEARRVIDGARDTR